LLDDLGGHPHVAVAADLGDSNGRHRLLEFCKGLGQSGVSLLINSAGVNEFSLFEAQSQTAITNLINVNLLSPILVCQDLLPLLRQQDGARIVNIGSTFGSIGYPGFGAYCASKFGLRGFTESLRRELSNSGVQISYIAPRATLTDLNSDTIVAMNNALGTAMDHPSHVADEVMEIISAPAGRDRYLGWPEKLFVRVNALLPGVVDRSLLKQLPIIRRFAKQGI
jgi:short-subunit dehydrogenase